MLRTATRTAHIARSALRASVTAAPSACPPRYMLSVGARFNSSQPPLSAEEKAKLKESLDRRDALQKDWDARELSYDEVKQRSLQPSETAFLIDVREPDEVVQGSIPSAVNLPLSVLATSLQLDPTKFEQQFGYKKPKLSQEVVFYCRSGKRSSTASDVAKRNGYTNIFNYKGSWLDWVQREGKSST